MLRIEIIVRNVEEAKLAANYADELELIHDFTQGGLSPSAAISQAVCAAVSIPVHVMVRPQGNSFVYTDKDIAIILDEIAYLRDHTQAYGIVFGALDSEGHIDTHLLHQVINSKGRLALTFHRAIDASTDPIAAYQTLLNYPEIDRVLTSGGAATAEQGLSNLRKMVELSREHQHATILAGSGITPNNARLIIETTGVQQIHIGTGIRQNFLLAPLKLQQLAALKT